MNLVACGAAIHAALLNNDSFNESIHMKLIDVAPLSLGIAVGDDSQMSVVIPRNTTIPVKRTKGFQTALILK